MKSRIIPSKVIEKYATKITTIEPDVTRVVEEEKAEAEIAMLENRANRMQNELTHGPNDRAWIDKTKKKAGKKKEAINGVGKKERIKRKMEGLEPEERELHKTADFHVRAAKRARRPKKLITCPENEPNRRKKPRGTRGGSANKRGKKSKNR